MFSKLVWTLRWPQRALLWLSVRLGVFYLLLMPLAIMAWIGYWVYHLPRSTSVLTFCLVVFGGAFALMAILLQPFIAIDRGIWEANQAYLRADGAWVEWTYTPEEWQQFMATEQRQLGRDKIAVVIICLLLGGFGTFLAGVVFRTPLAVAIALALSVGFLLLFLLRAVNAVRRRKNLRGLVEVRINRTGIEEAGTYTQIAGIGQVLQEVAIATGQPSILRFVSRSHNGRHTILSEVRLPVPHGREDEAEALVARFMAVAEPPPPSPGPPERANGALA